MKVHRIGAAALSGLLALTIIIVGAGATMSAQERPGPQPGPARQGQGRGPVPDVIALQDLFDSYVLMQSQRQLQLTPEQAPQFVLRLGELQAARRRAMRQRTQALNELRRLVQSPAARKDEGQTAQIQDRLKNLDAVDARSASEIRQALANLDQVLDPFQQARFRLLEEQMERNKLDLLMQARRGARPPGRF